GHAALPHQTARSGPVFGAGASALANRRLRGWPTDGQVIGLSTNALKCWASKLPLVTRIGAAGELAASRWSRPLASRHAHRRRGSGTKRFRPSFLFIVDHRRPHGSR